MSQESHTRKQINVADRIQCMIQAMLGVLAEPGGKLVIELKSQSKAHGNWSFNRETSALDVSVRAERRVLCFPGSSPEEALRFTIFLRILDLVHEALVTGVVTTKRDIYYKEPKLFRNQSTVDRCVDDLAFHFGVTRSALNVTAAAKGLVAGHIQIIWRSGNESAVQDEVDGMLIPNICDLAFVNLSSISWILIIEKEATFRTLVSRGFHIDGPHLGILMTAKGYPDISSRTFLRYLSEQPSSALENTLPPIYILVDNDPDGLAIMSTYKYGSARLSHENAALVIPRLLYLGVETSDITSHEDIDEPEEHLLHLTARDRKKAACMLDWPVFAEDGPEPERRKDLQVMLMLSYKAEMQVFGEGGGMLEGLLKGKMSELTKLSVNENENDDGDDSMLLD